MDCHWETWVWINNPSKHTLHGAVSHYVISMTLDNLHHSLGTNVLVPKTGLFPPPRMVPTIVDSVTVSFLPSDMFTLSHHRVSLGATRTSQFFILRDIWMEFRSFAFPIWKQEHRSGNLINMQCHNILLHSNIWSMIKCINSEHHRYLWLHLSMKANEFPLAWVSLEINLNVTKCISQEMFDVAWLAYESLICSWFTP